MKFSGRTALVTGGTSGIGLSLARLLVARGNTVLITGRDPARLDGVKRELPGVDTFRSDVGDPAQIAELHEQILARHPALDYWSTTPASCATSGSACTATLRT